MTPLVTIHYSSKWKEKREKEECASPYLLEKISLIYCFLDKVFPLKYK